MRFVNPKNRPKHTVCASRCHPSLSRPHKTHRLQTSQPQYPHRGTHVRVQGAPFPHRHLCMKNRTAFLANATSPGLTLQHQGCHPPPNATATAPLFRVQVWVRCNGSMEQRYALCIRSSTQASNGSKQAVVAKHMRQRRVQVHLHTCMHECTESNTCAHAAAGGTKHIMCDVGAWHTFMVINQSLLHHIICILQLQSIALPTAICTSQPSSCHA